MYGTRRYLYVTYQTRDIRSVAQYQYRSISRGKHSVFEQLKKEKIPVDDYIGFYSLRNWGKVKTSPTTTSSFSSRKESGGSSVVKDSSILQSPLQAKRNIMSKRRAINKSRSSSQNKSLEDIAAQEQFQQQQLLEMQQNEYNDGRLDFLTEQVYIHSKLMIVDDRTVICGSGTCDIHTWVIVQTNLQICS